MAQPSSTFLSGTCPCERNKGEKGRANGDMSPVHCETVPSLGALAPLHLFRLSCTKCKQAGRKPTLHVPEFTSQARSHVGDSVLQLSHTHSCKPARGSPTGPLFAPINAYTGAVLGNQPLQRLTPSKCIHAEIVTKKWCTAR